MSQTLTADAAGAPIPSGAQNVAIITGTNANGSTQAPANASNAIWFAFSIGGGSASLNVNFNGQNYQNVPPGSYSLGNLTTPLSLDVSVNGSVKLAWINS